ncbi:MAG: hypothetical protein WC897_06245 [Candidatus Gracilibacteria bacterium]
MNKEEKITDLFQLIKDFRKKIEISKALAEDALEFCKNLECTIPDVKTEIELEEKIGMLQEKLEKEEKLYEKLDDELTTEKSKPKASEVERSIILITLEELIDYTPDSKLRDQLKKFVEMVKIDRINGNSSSGAWLQLQ